jgi:hypothetical protein
LKRGGRSAAGRGRTLYTSGLATCVAIAATGHSDKEGYNYNKVLFHLRCEGWDEQLEEFLRTIGAVGLVDLQLSISTGNSKLAEERLRETIKRIDTATAVKVRSVASGEMWRVAIVTRSSNLDQPLPKGTVRIDEMSSL